MSKNKSEIRYLHNKDSIKQILTQYHWSDIYQAMIDSLDSIDDLNVSQSIEMFRLVSMLQDAIISYERVATNVNNETTKV